PSQSLSPHFPVFFFFLTDNAPTAIYTLSLHDALPISGSLAPARKHDEPRQVLRLAAEAVRDPRADAGPAELLAPGERQDLPRGRSEEHTSELQSRGHLVCRLLLEKKKLPGAACELSTF